MTAKIISFPEPVYSDANPQTIEQHQAEREHMRSFEPGQRVLHDKLGAGKVTWTSKNRMRVEVLFDNGRVGGFYPAKLEHVPKDWEF